MAFLTGIAEGLANHRPFAAIEEDSLFMKALSFIPIVGVFASLTQELSLKGKIEIETDPNRTIRLVNVKNNYISAGTVRNFLNTALLVAAIALDIFQGWIWVIYTALFAGLAARDIYRFVNNSRAIDLLRSTGVKEGMWIS